MTLDPQSSTFRPPPSEVSASLPPRPSALDLIAARPELFARQGSVAASWRRVGPKKYGPYYRLRYRDGGVSRSLYLGRQGPLVDCVRERLRTLQAPLRQRRAFDQLNGCIRYTLRLDRRQVAAQLAHFGLRLKGFEVRGWRTSPLAALLCPARLGLRSKGFEVCGGRTSPLSALLRWPGTGLGRGPAPRGGCRGERMRADSGKKTAEAQPPSPLAPLPRAGEGTIHSSLNPPIRPRPALPRPAFGRCPASGTGRSQGGETRDFRLPPSEFPFSLNSRLSAVHLARMGRVRFVFTGRAAQWLRQSRPEIPWLPPDRLDAFLDARDARDARDGQGE